MVKNIVLFLSFLFLTGIYNLNAQITSIPDTVFEQYLIDNNIDSDATLNGQVLTSDISGVTVLNIIGYNISNFEGLQNFTYLTEFTHINNQTATSFNIDLSGFFQLNKITIINTPNLSSVNVNYSYSLNDLTIVTRGSLFTSINLSSTGSLTSLSLADNAISTIDLSDQLYLTYLSVAINPLTSLDTSSLTELESLDTYLSQITSLDLSYNKKLTRLWADRGNLNSLNLKNGFNNLLTSVLLDSNPALTCIQVDNPTAANSASGWVKDSGASYSNYCGNIIVNYPYEEDFENGNAGWYARGDYASWELVTPIRSFNSVFDGAASGNYAWVTLNNRVNENSWVESPVFDLSSLSNPYVKLNIWWDSDSGYDGTVLQSSTDYGVTWQNVGSYGDYINWYNYNSIVGTPGDQSIGWSGSGSQNGADKWKTASHPLSNLIGQTNVMFRIAYGSNNFWNNSGFAFDLFSIFDKPNSTCNAGEDTVTTYCGTSNLDLNNYLHYTADLGGSWESLDDVNTSNNGIVDASNFNNGIYRFKYTTAANGGSCTDEAIITISFIRLFNNKSFSYNANCVSVTEADFFSIMNITDNVDKSGTFYFCSSKDEFGDCENFIEVDFTIPVGSGKYEYRVNPSADCAFYSKAYIEITGYPLAYAGMDKTFYIDYFEFNNLDDLLFNGIASKQASNAKKLVFSRRWRLKSDSNKVEVSEDGDVDFPNTGAGPTKFYQFEYIVTEDACGGSTDTAIITVAVQGYPTHQETELLICEGDTLTENMLNEALSEDLYWFGGTWTPELNGPGVYNGVDDLNNVATVTVTNSSCYTKIYLQGAYNTNTGIMNDNLRVNDLISLESPYADQLIIQQSILDVSGNNAIVDWIWAELRDSSNNQTIVSGKSGLLQRNGRIVDLDGVNSLTFSVPNGNYYYVISHRNHLGIITTNTVSVNNGIVIVDLTTDNTLIFGENNALKTMSDGKLALFSGDFNGDGQIQNTDKSAIEPLRGISGYLNADLDMNGEVQNTDINNILNPNLGKGEQFTSKKLHAKRSNK